MKHMFSVLLGRTADESLHTNDLEQAAKVAQHVWVDDDKILVSLKDLLINIGADITDPQVKAFLIKNTTHPGIAPFMTDSKSVAQTVMDACLPGGPCEKLQAIAVMQYMTHLQRIIIQSAVRAYHAECGIKPAEETSTEDGDG